MALTPGALFFAHMRDGPMIRVRLPGGSIATGQLRTLAELSRSAGNGLIDLTNRANLQIRGLERITAKQLKRDLGNAGLLTRGLWADRLRNILADPLAGHDNTEIIDSHPVVAALDAEIQKTPELSTLLPEFQFVVDGGGRSGIAGAGHDAGLIAEHIDGAARYRLSLAGATTRLAARPEHAALLAVAAARAALIAAGPPKSAIVKRLRAYAWGARTGASHAAMILRFLLSLGGLPESRIRHLVKQLGVEDIARVAGDLAGAGVIEAADPGPDRRLHPSIGIVPGNDPKQVSCGLGVPVGRLDAAMMHALADLADDFGNGTVSLSPWHVIFVHAVAASRASALLDAASGAGFAVDPAFVQLKVFACSGRAGCRGARLNAKEDGKNVIAALSAAFGGEPLAGLGPQTVHISGCAKGCAHRAPADLLAIEGQGSYRIYENCAAGATSARVSIANTVMAQDLPGEICQLVKNKLPRPASLL